MSETVNIKNTGLRGVTVADTKISFIDGGEGVLIYRGYRIEELAEKSSFVETAYLLLNGYLPGSKELDVFCEGIIREGTLPDFIRRCLETLPKKASPMDVLQSAVPLLAASDLEAGDETRKANVGRAMRIIALMPALTAAWHRIRSGFAPLPHDPRLSHAGNLLYQIRGEKPDTDIERYLDACLILHADHTFNASTFACREVVSTRAHMYAGVAAGIGALSGPLHGGANAQVLKMLTEIESERDISGWVRRRLDRKQRIMGMGHAVYKTMDPRAKILKEISRRLGEKTGQSKWYELSAAVEEAALAEFEKRGKTTLRPNVDFWSASVYHMMGIPGDLMTPVFAMARSAGWCAHIIEEKFAEAQERPALYRPESEYVGNYCGRMGCVYEPIGERKSI